MQSEFKVNLHLSKANLFDNKDHFGFNINDISYGMEIVFVHKIKKKISK